MAHEPIQWNWTVLRAGSFKLDGGAMFGIIPKALWAKLAAPDEMNRITLQTNCVLLDDGRRKVLIESGYGNKFGAKERGIYALEGRWIGDALDEIGVDRTDIGEVVLTHLHFDHAGGVTCHEPDSAGPQVSFPNARVHVQRREWEDALANRSTMTRTYLRENLDPIAERVNLLDGEAEAIPGIRVFPDPGHTWGQQAILFNDREGTLCFPGDVMPTANHAGLPFNMAYDVLPFENMQTKRALFERAGREGWRIILDHEPDEALRRVARDDSGRFSLTPA